jgi:hypothetical protein
MIRSGESFEALVTTLLFFEDPRAKLFGRRGRDGGQDARSGDGKTVYQAKHHEAPTPAKVIADAKREAENIGKYRTPDHERYAQWADITNWVLVTNASFNPTDEQTWQNEVIPLFKGLGLTATYWEQATLDGYLDKHPEVDRAFFGNENRVFLSPAEASLRVADADPFTQRVELAPYVGRDSDLKKLDDFLAGDRRFFLVHAAGGVGKTRFLLEGASRIAANGDWQVLWANTHSLQASSTWFDAVVPERPTLLCVDEPDDEQLILLLEEQLGLRTGRAQQWKIAFAVRSAKDPIVRALHHPSRKRWLEELQLNPLPANECEDMCCKLLETGKLAHTPESWRKDTAKSLAKRYDGFPIWLTLAVHLLEEEGSLATLPDSAREMCQIYLDEVLKFGRANEKLLQLARWVSLLGPINREDASELEYLAKRVECKGAQDVRSDLQRLTGARLLRKWGARDRLVDVKPDVLRDFILRDWFCEERDYGGRRFVPSEVAKSLVAELSQAIIEGTAEKRDERVLAALARVDFLLRYGNESAHLGDSLFAALALALPGMPPSRRVAMVEILAPIGPYYPDEMLQLLRNLRRERAGDETVTLFDISQSYSQDSVILELAQAHNRLAYGTLSDDQSAMMFEELYALALEEKRIAPASKFGLFNDGKRAEEVIRNLLENSPLYPREFGDVAAELVLRELRSTPNNQLSIERLGAVRLIVKPLCNVQRHQSWSEDSNLRMRTQVLGEAHDNRKGAVKALSRIREILEYDVTTLDVQARAILWDMFSEAHREANYAKRSLTDEASSFSAELNSRLLDDLRWVKALLQRRTLSARELRSARAVWHWHVECGEEGALGALAQELETVYLSDSTVQLFESLTDWEKPEDTQRGVESKALELAIAGVHAMQSFVAQAMEFLGSEGVQSVHSVASALGRDATKQESVRTFLSEGFQTYSRGTAAYDFVMSGLCAWVFNQRREGQDEAAKLVSDLLGRGNAEKRLDLLRILYSGHRNDEVLIASTPEIELIRRHKPLFAQTNAVQDYISCTLWGLRHDWPGLKADFEELLHEASDETRGHVTRLMATQLYQVLHGEKAAETPADLLQWFWGQLVETPDLGCIEHERRWYVGEIVKVLGKAPLYWLVDAIRRRASRQLEARGRRFDPPSKLVPLVAVAGPDNIGEPKVQTAIGELVALLGESAPMDRWLPELLARIDPQGLEVPRHVAALIAAEIQPDRVCKLVRTACHYKVGTLAWRQIARPAYKAAQPMPKENSLRVYYASAETVHPSCTTAAGTVAQVFVDAVEAAKRGQAEELEKDFAAFWEWRLRRAEGKLRDEQEELKEEVWD